MSFQFGNRSVPGSSNQAYGNNNYMPNQQYGSNYPGYSGNNQMYAQPQQYYQQQQPQMQMPTPTVNILPPGQAPDPNMKVIKLNWGDLLGGSGANASQGLKVAMLGPNGDVNSACPGLKCTFNGQVPQGMPVHVMQINPYGNMNNQQR